MKSIIRDSVAGIVAILVATAIVAFVPITRGWAVSALVVEIPLSAWHLALIIVFALSGGGSVTWLILRPELHSGKHDSMTGALRADQINHFLEKRLKEARNSNSTFGVLLVDIDNFKEVNDNYNHEIGNATLQEVAEVIQPRSKGEQMFRYGGDEFFIITNLGTDDRACWGYANRLIRDVSKYPFLGDARSDQRITLTVSCGCAIITGEQTVASARQGAVTALKEAKQPSAGGCGGKGRACLFKEPGHT